MSSWLSAGFTVVNGELLAITFPACTCTALFRAEYSCGADKKHRARGISQAAHARWGGRKRTQHLPPSFVFLAEPRPAHKHKRDGEIHWTSVHVNTTYVLARTSLNHSYGIVVTNPTTVAHALTLNQHMPAKKAETSSSVMKNNVVLPYLLPHEMIRR